MKDWVFPKMLCSMGGLFLRGIDLDLLSSAHWQLADSPLVRVETLRGVGHSPPGHCACTALPWPGK